MLVLANKRKETPILHLVAQDRNTLCGVQVLKNTDWQIEIYRRGAICEHCIKLQWEVPTVDGHIWRGR